MAEDSGAFIFHTNIKDVAAEIHGGLRAIASATNIPDTPAGKSFLSGITRDVRRETTQLARDVRAYKAELDALQKLNTPLGNRPTLAQYSNQRLQQSNDAFRSSVLNRASGSGLKTSEITKVYEQLERAFLKRATDELRNVARGAKGEPAAAYYGRSGEITRSPLTDSNKLRTALLDQERVAQEGVTAVKATTEAQKKTAAAANAVADSTVRAARAGDQNADVAEKLLDVNRKNLRAAQQKTQPASAAPAQSPAKAPTQPAAKAPAQPAQQPTASRRPTDDIVNPLGGFREPTGPYAGPWKQKSYRTSGVGKSETQHILDMAASEGVDPGFSLTKGGIRVHDPNQARYQLDGAYQVASDNVDDSHSAEDKRLYTLRRDSMRKLIDAIGQDRDALLEDAAKAVPAVGRPAKKAGSSGGGKKPPEDPPALPGPEPEPEPEPERRKVIQGVTADEARQAERNQLDERQDLENLIARRVDDPNDPLRKINKTYAYDPTADEFFRRKLNKANPEPEVTRPVDIQHAREDLAARYETDHGRANREEERRNNRRIADEQRALAREITEARKADPTKIVRVTGTGGVRTGVEADLRDENNPRYFERINNKQLRQLDPQNADDVLKLDEATRNLTRMRQEAAKSTRNDITRAEKAGHAENDARDQRTTALRLQAARQAAPDQFVDVKGSKGVVADLRNDANNPDYYKPVGQSGGMRRLDPNDETDRIKITDVQGKLAKQQTAEYQRALRDLDKASERAAKEKSDAQKAVDKKQQKAIADQIKAQQKEVQDQAKQFDKDWNAAHAENRVRTAKSERAFGRDYDAAHAEDTAHDQRELHRDLIATRNAMPEKFATLPGGITASLLDPNDPRFFQRAGRGQVRYLDPSHGPDQSTIDEARRNLAVQRQAEADRQKAKDDQRQAADQRQVDARDQSQRRDYDRQQAQQNRENERQQARAELDRQRTQRAGLEMRLLGGDPTVSDVPRRGVYGGGYIDRSLDPKNPLFYERQRNGGLTQLNRTSAVDEAKVQQALASEVVALDRANTATLRRAKAEERSEATLDKQVGSFGGGGIGGGFARGFLSGGFGGGGEGNSLESLARSAGTTVKYAALYRTLSLVTTAAGAAAAQLLDMDDSVTELEVAMGKGSTVSGDFTNSLQDVAAEGGFNVGEAMDAAASGIRAFKDATDGSQESVNALGEGFARQAQRIAVLSKTDLTDAAGNLKAAVSGFNLDPNEASFRRITDAIAGGKLAGGGDEKDLSQFMASGAVSFQQAGFNPEETASIGSKLISSLDESGTLAASRSSRIFSILQGGSGKSYLRELNAQISSLNQTRDKSDQIGTIDIKASAGQQVLQLADAYAKLNKQQQQVLLNRIGGTGQSRELQVMLETIRQQVKDASGGFDNKGVEEYQKRLDNIRARLNQIKGDVIAIVTNLASSGVLIPLEALLGLLQPVVRMMRELTQALRFLEQIPGFQWVEQLALAGVALRAMLPMLQAVRQQGIRGALGIAEQRIAPGRALSRQRLQEAKDASEVGGILAQRRIAGGGRFDLGVEDAKTNLDESAKVAGRARDNLHEARDRRSRLTDELSQLQPDDAKYAELKRNIQRLDKVIARRAAGLARLTDAFGGDRDALEEAMRRQGLAQGVNDRYDRARESLSGRHKQDLEDIGQREARDQRRIDRVGGSPAQDYDALREEARQRHARELEQLHARHADDLDRVASRDLDAPTGFGRFRQRYREGFRDVGESIADRGWRGAFRAGRDALPQDGALGSSWTTVFKPFTVAADGLKNIPAASRAVTDSFTRLRSQGVNPLMAMLRSPGNAITNTSGYDKANDAVQGLLGQLNGRDEQGNAPIGGTRTQRAGNTIKGVLGSELGWLGGGLLAADMVMQIKGSFDDIKTAASAGRAASDVNLAGANAADLKSAAESLNAAASNLDEATGGFSGWIADNLFNSGQGGQQAGDLRNMADFRDAASGRLDALHQGAAQSGQGNRYADAIDLSTPDELNNSLQQLTDSLVPASDRVTALSVAIKRLGEVSADGAISPEQREKLASGAGEAAGTALEQLKSRESVPTLGGFGHAANKWLGLDWLTDHTGGHSDQKDLEHRLQTRDISMVEVQGDASIAARQAMKQGANLTTDQGKKIFADLYSKMLEPLIPKTEDRAAIVNAVVANLGSVATDAGVQTPYMSAVGMVNDTITEAQAKREQTALEDQANAIANGTDYDGGLHAMQVMRDWLKGQRANLEKTFQALGLSKEQIKLILNALGVEDQKDAVDQAQIAQQNNQLLMRRRGQRRRHDLQNTTDPKAIEGRRNQDNQDDLLGALDVSDKDTAAQVMSGMTPDQIKAARKALQDQVDAEKTRLTPVSPFGGSNEGAPAMKPSPHLLHLQHEQTLLNQAAALASPEFTQGDIDAASQTAQAQKSGSQAAVDAANVATAWQGVLDAERQYGKNSKQAQDARGQYNAALRSQASDAVERAIADRNVMADTSSALDAANRAAQDAADRAADAAQRGDKDEENRQNKLKQVAELQRTSAQRELEFLQQRARMDTTNPAALAAQEAKEAAQRAADARKDPRTKQDHQQALDNTAKDAQLNAEKVAHDQWLSDLEEKDKLGDISHRKFIESLQRDIARLKAKKKLTYEEQKEYDADREAMKAAQDQLTGQFNLGTIKLPSIYEVRRAALAQALPGTAGASGTSTSPVLSAGSVGTTTAADVTKTSAAAAVNNTTNNVTINGADFAKVVDYLNKVFHKTQRIATTPRKA